MQPEELYKLLRRSWNRFAHWRSEEEFLHVLRNNEQRYTLHVYIQQMHRKKPKSYLDMLKRSWPLSQVYLVNDGETWHALYANGDTSGGRFRHNYFIDHILTENIAMSTSILVENRNKLVAKHQYGHYAYLDDIIGFNYDFTLGKNVRDLVVGKPHSSRKPLANSFMDYQILFFDGKQEQVIHKINF